MLLTLVAIFSLRSLGSLSFLSCFLIKYVERPELRTIATETKSNCRTLHFSSQFFPPLSGDIATCHWFYTFVCIISIVQRPFVYYNDSRLHFSEYLDACLSVRRCCVTCTFDSIAKSAQKYKKMAKQVQKRMIPLNFGRSAPRSTTQWRNRKRKGRNSQKTCQNRKTRCGCCCCSWMWRKKAHTVHSLHVSKHTTNYTHTGFASIRVYFVKIYSKTAGTAIGWGRAACLLCFPCSKGGKRSCKHLNRIFCTEWARVCSSVSMNRHSFLALSIFVRCLGLHSKCI